MKLGTLWTSRLTKVASYTFLIAFLGVMLLPFAWMVSTSFKTLEEVAQVPVRWIPDTLRFSNYRDVFSVIPLARHLFNSFFVATVVTVATVLVSALAAYAFARIQFRNRELLFVLYLSTMMVPSQVTMIPNFILMRYLGWLDTYYALTVPMFFSAFGVFMLRQFFLTIPFELEEAARIDGCSRLRSFRSIILPLAKPALVTLAIFTFLNEWNSFLWPLIVINSTELQPIQVGLRIFQTEFGTQWPLLMAGSVVAELPIIVLYLFAQRYVIEGFTATGVKG